jgi:uncharacterized membrane protein
MDVLFMSPKATLEIPILWQTSSTEDLRKGALSLSITLILHLHFPSLYLLSDLLHYPKLNKSSI